MLTHHLFLLALLVSFLEHKFVASKLIHNEDDIQVQYDYIIVGAGTAGCILANRLSANSKNQVLLIEAGGSTEENPFIAIPFLAALLTGGAQDWNFTSTSQPGLNGRVVSYQRGKVVGGTGSVDHLIWNRGSNDMYDRWAQITGDPGWSAKSVEKYYLKTSRIVPPVDGHNITGQYIPSAHGDGPVEITFPGFPTLLDDKILNASKQLGGRFDRAVDFNAGISLGFAEMQSATGRGKRSSSATAYLEPVMNRTNLDVLIRTLVTKVQPSTSSTYLRLDTVQIANSSDPSGPRRLLKAKKEVVLAAGAFGTPQLLLLSGIGPASTLSKHQIKPILVSPGVGQNLTEQPALPTIFSVNSNLTNDNFYRDPTVLNGLLQEYQTTGKGLLTDTVSNTIGFIRLPSDSPILKKFGDPSSGPGAAHIEFLPVDGFIAFPGQGPQPATGGFLTMATVLMTPTSRGEVTLASNDPFDKPLINPALLTTEFDTATLIQSVKDTYTLLSTPAWSGFIAGPYGPLVNVTTDELLLEYTRNHTVHLSHPVGTAAMSPPKADWGVVNPDLTLKGAKGLRIVDASIFPTMPECHPSAIVYTVAERAADLILTQYSYL